MTEPSSSLERMVAPDFCGGGGGIAAGMWCSFSHLILSCLANYCGDDGCDVANRHRLCLTSLNLTWMAY